MRTFAGARPRWWQIAAGVAVVTALSVVVASIAQPPSAAAIDAAFAAFWSAATPEEAALIVPHVVRTGVTFDEAVRRLKKGRPYQSDVETGVVRSVRTAHGKDFYYAVNVPRTYDPARTYQLRFQLHGGVTDESNFPRTSGNIGTLAGAEQIYVLPTSWIEARWWDPWQVENLAAILDVVKRVYNVDENRVVVSGSSDGATGTYYIAMKDTTPYASFLPLNGNPLVLRYEHVGDLFVTNLRNKPLFVVNGGHDPIYPADVVGPYVQHLKDKGVDVVFRSMPDGEHDTSWWPDVRDSFEAFVRSHPRDPLPDKLTWESGGSSDGNRAHWLVIDRLAPTDAGAPALDDVNVLDAAHDPLGLGPRLFNIAHPSGRVDAVRAGNTVTATTRGVAEFTLLLSPDVFDLSRTVKVIANGRTVFDGRVASSVETLLRWAARDNDRTMLFAAELRVKA